MSLIKGLFDRQKSENEPFAPTATVPRSTTQEAVQYVMDNAGGGGGGSGAPTDAEYLVRTADATLTNERAVTDTSTIVWDWSTVNQAKASLQHLGIESLSDPGADRGIFWDDSSGALSWMLAGTGLGFIGTYLSITDADLVAIADASFSAGDVLYHDGTTLTRLAAGTDGQFLRTRGSGGTPPDWQNISGGGDMLRANNLSDLTSAATGRTNLGVAIGSDVQAYDAGLQSISGLTTAADKMIYATALDTYAVTDLTAFARSILDDANEATFKATVNLEIGTDVQAYDATLQSISALGTAADKLAYTTGIDTWAETALTSFGRSLIDDADASTARSTLGLVIGTDVQAYDAELAALAGLVSDADKVPYFTGSGTAAVADFTSFGRSLVDDANASAARTTLGLVIGTDVQAYDSELAALAGLTSAADKLPYWTGAGTAANADFTSFGRSLVDDANASAARTTLGLVIGTDVQAYDSELAALAGLTSAADALPYFTGIGTAGTTTLTSFMRTVLDDTDAATARATLGLTIGTNVQAYDADLTTWAGLTPSANAQSLVTAADYAAMRALLDLEAGTDFYSKSAADAAFQPLDSDLTAIAALATTTAGRSVLTIADPNADRIIAWDDTAGGMAAIALADLTDEASPATGDYVLIYGAEGDLRKADWSTLPGGGSSANTALSNLASVAINTTLVSDTDNTDDIGTSSVWWRTGYFKTGIEIGSTDTTLTRSAAGILAVEGTVIKNTGKETIWIPATAMKARTTNGAASGTAEMTTNKNMFATLDFDTTTQEFAQFEIHMPKSWNLGTVTFQPVWSHASTATNFGVVWALQAIARSNDDVGDVAFGTAQTSTDTGGTTNDIYIGPESSAITVGGTPAAGDTVQFQIKRNVSDGSDTMAIDARLHGIRVFFTTNAATDA